jgi:hypothetical protein
MVFSRSRKRPGLEELKLTARVGLDIARWLRIGNPIIVVMVADRRWIARMDSAEEAVRLIAGLMNERPGPQELYEFFFVIPLDDSEPVIVHLRGSGFEWEKEVLWGDVAKVPDTLREALGVKRNVGNVIQA